MLHGTAKLSFVDARQRKTRMGERERTKTLGESTLRREKQGTAAAGGNKGATKGKASAAPRVRANALGAENAWDKPTKQSHGWIGPPPTRATSSQSKSTRSEKRKGARSATSQRNTHSPVKQNQGKKNEMARSGEPDGAKEMPNELERRMLAAFSRVFAVESSEPDGLAEAVHDIAGVPESAPMTTSSLNALLATLGVPASDKSARSLLSRAQKHTADGSAAVTPDVLVQHLRTCAAEPHNVSSCNEKNAPGSAEIARSKHVIPCKGPLTADDKQQEQNELSCDGAVQYPGCKEVVYAPSGFDPSVTRQSASLPIASLKRERVFGCRCSAGVAYTSTGNLLTSSRSYGVVLDPEHHRLSSEQHFLGHLHDITAVAVIPNKVKLDGVHYKTHRLAATVECATASNTVPKDNRKRGDKGHSSSGGPKVCVWDSCNPTSAALREVSLGKRRGRVTCMAFSPDGKQMVVSCPGDGTVCVFDWRTGRLLGEGAGPSSGANDVAWHPTHSDRFAIVGNAHASVWMYDQNAGQYVHAQCSASSLGGNSQELQSAVMLPGLTDDEPVVLAGSLDGRLHAFRGKTHVRSLQAHISGANSTAPGVHALHFRSKADRLISVGGDGAVNEWDVSKGMVSSSSCIGTLGHSPTTEPILSLDVYESGRGQQAYALGLATGAIAELESTEKGAQYIKHALPVRRQKVQSVTTVAWLPPRETEGQGDTARLAIITSSGMIWITNANSGEITFAAESGMQSVNCSAISPSYVSKEGEHHLAIGAGGSSGKVRVFALEEFEEKATIIAGQGSGCTSIAFAPQSKFLAVAHNDCTIRVYKPRSGYEMVSKTHEINAPARAIDFSMDASVFQAGGFKPMPLGMFESRAGRSISSKTARDIELASHTSCIGFNSMGLHGSGSICCQRSLKGQHIVSGTRHGDVQVRNFPCVAENAPANTYRAHAGGVAAIRLSWDGMRLSTLAAAHDEVVTWQCDDFDASEGEPDMSQGTTRRSASDAISSEQQEGEMTHPERSEATAGGQRRRAWQSNAASTSVAEEERTSPMRARAQRLQEAKRQAEEAEKMAQMGYAGIDDPYGFDPAEGAAQELLAIEREALEDESDEDA